MVVEIQKAANVQVLVSVSERLLQQTNSATATTRAIERLVASSSDSLDALDCEEEEVDHLSTFLSSR